MSTRTESTVGYVATIRKLRERRAELRDELAEVEGALKHLERLQGIIPSEPYRGMTAAEGALAHLERVGKPQAASEIARALVEGGYETTAKSFAATVYNRLIKEQVRGTVFRANGLWYLDAWRGRVDPEDIDEVDIEKYQHRTI